MCFTFKNDINSTFLTLVHCDMQTSLYKFNYRFSYPINCLVTTRIKLYRALKYIYGKRYIHIVVYPIYNKYTIYIDRVYFSLSPYISRIILIEIWRPVPYIYIYERLNEICNNPPPPGRLRVIKLMVVVLFFRIYLFLHYVLYTIYRITRIWYT